MIRSPRQAVYDTVFLLCKEVGQTFDFLPDAETQYPFIHIGQSSNLDVENSDLLGEVNLTINLWGTRVHRLDLDNMLVQIHDKLKELRVAFDYSINLVNFSSMLLDDLSTGSPLLHQVIELTFDYTRR